MDNNWIIDNLNYAFGVWNDKLTEMWSLLTQSPQAFKGGTIWQTIQTVNGAMQGIGYGLLVLFLAIGIFRSSAGFRDFQRPEHILRHFIYRCTANIYRKYIHKYEGDPPTLKDLYDDLMRQKEPVAHEIALALELFTTGSLNVFAYQTNIDTRNRIICYDIQDLGENLKPIGLLVMLDSILNRVIRNRQQGRYTHVYIDEIYLFFASPGVGGKSAINNYSSEFLYKCWKRFRKYYATLTGITQNVEECLLSDTARLMFANSEFLVLLNQAPTDRAELAKLLDARDAQMDYVSDAPAGHGLIKVGSCLVPFINELPRDTELYRLMTTKPGEQNA